MGTPKTAILNNVGNVNKINDQLCMKKKRKICFFSQYKLCLYVHIGKIFNLAKINSI